MDRDEAISEIRQALKRRSGKDWSVKGGRGTGWGWITIDVPPRRQPRTDDDLAELGQLLGLGRACYGAESIPASTEYRLEYVDRANGRTPAISGTQYWD